MAVTQYIGARYVQVFADPAEWSNAKEYEPLTVVLHEGNSFTSKQFVPVGIDINNEKYWAETGNFNAQVEQYRREVSQALDAATTAQNDIDTLLPKADFSAENTVKDYIDNTYNSNIYNITKIASLDKTGVNDISSVLVEAINRLEIGSTIRFETGTYKISTVNLPSGYCYDFNNSIILCGADATVINCAGTFKAVTRLSAENAKNSNKITVQNPANLSAGDLVVISDPTQLAHTARDYYYKGFTSKIVNINESVITLANSVPYNLSSLTTTVTAYTPFVGEVKNISDFVPNSTAMQNCNGLWIDCGLNVIVENINFSNMLSHCIYSYHSYGTQIRNCHINCSYESLPSETNITNPYFITIGSSTDTITENCSGVNYWHCWTSGAHETPLHNIVTNCNFKSLVVPAIFDHENAINTIVTNCMANGYGIAALGMIDDCVNIVNTAYSYIRAVPHSTPELAIYSFSNIITIMNDDNSVPNLFQTGITPQTDATDFYINSLTITNCSCDKTSQVNVTVKYYKCITLINCNNLIPFVTSMSQPDADSDATVKMIGCNINCDYFTDSVITHNCYIKNMIFDNCKFYGYEEHEIIPRYNLMGASSEDAATVIISNCRFDVSTTRLLLFRISSNCNAYIYNTITNAVFNTIPFLDNNNNVYVYNSDIYVQNPSVIRKAVDSIINGTQIPIGLTNGDVRCRLAIPATVGPAEWVTW